MGYEMPLVTKTINLPFVFDESPISLDEYKDKYGIDLRQWITLVDGMYIYFAIPNAVINLVDVTPNTQYGVYPVTGFTFDDWQEGVQDGNIVLKSSSEGAALTLFISKDSAFTMDNIKVQIFTL